MAPVPVQVNQSMGNVDEESWVLSSSAREESRKQGTR